MEGGIFVKTLAIVVVLVTLQEFGGVQAGSTPYYKRDECDIPGLERKSCGKRQSDKSCNDVGCCWDGSKPKGKQCFVSKDLVSRTVASNQASCYCSGAKHCSTFDSKRYQFTGTCGYTFVRDGCDDGVPRRQTVPTFEVVLDFNRFSKDDMFSEPFRAYFYVKKDEAVGREEVKVTPNGYVFVNGVHKKHFPATTSGETFVRVTAQHTEFTLFNNVSITWSNYSRKVEVSVPDSLQNKICGLCGNYDGNPDNDFRMGYSDNKCDNIKKKLRQNKHSVLADTVNEFGISWIKVANISTCSPRVCTLLEDPDTACSENARNRARAKWDATFGSFKESLSAFLPGGEDKYKTIFVNETCMLPKIDRRTLCTWFSTNMDIALANGAFPEWTERPYCPFDVSCPFKMEYKLGYMDQPTCLDKTVSEIGRLREGCYCKEGYVADGKTCFPKEECGCVHKGTEYALHDTFIDEECIRRYTCERSGKGLHDKDAECPIGHLCSVHEGERRCVCPAHYVEKNVKNQKICVPLRKGQCKVMGSMHFQTFDGYNYTYPGACRYIFAQDGCTDGSKQTFRILVDPHLTRSGKRDSAKIKEVIIQVMSEGKSCEFIYNGKDIEEDRKQFCKNYVTIDKKGSKYTVSLPDPKNPHIKSISVILQKTRLLVDAPVSMNNSICGMCGNFNNDARDDLRLGSFDSTENLQTNDPLAFGYSWTDITDTDAGCANERNEIFEDVEDADVKETSHYKMLCEVKLRKVFEAVLDGGKLDDKKVEELVEICAQDTVADNDSFDANVCDAGEELNDLLPALNLPKEDLTLLKCDQTGLM